LAAVMGTLAALLVPFIQLTVKLFRGMHPEAIVLAPAKPNLPPVMLMSFGLSMAAFLLLFVALLRLRFRWAALRDARAAMEAA
jgi:heme exporter protein C